MKGFMLAVVSLLLVVGICTASAVLLTQRSKELLSLQKQLKDSPVEERAETFSRLLEKWQAFMGLYGLCAHRVEFDYIDELMAETGATVEKNSDSEFYVAVAKLEFGLKRLAGAAGFHAEDIF